MAVITRGKNLSLYEQRVRHIAAGAKIAPAEDLMKNQTAEALLATIYSAHQTAPSADIARANRHLRRR